MSNLVQVDYRFSRGVSLQDRLLSSFVCSRTGCWDWVRGKTPRGYGMLTFKGRGLMAHRAVYELLIGKIPNGKVLDHLCENTSCVNPSHLKVTTQRENVLRGAGITASAARQTHCRRGHNFTRLDNQGKRVCQLCRTKLQRLRRANP